MRKSVIAIIIIVLVVLYMSVFVVKEGERGITLRFGKVLRDDDNKPLVYEPGLHFKIPFIETVKITNAAGAKSAVRPLSGSVRTKRQTQ